MNLERLFADWQATHGANPAHAHNLIADATTRILDVDAEATAWLVASLADEQRKFFTAALFAEAPAMPEALYAPMLRAAVYETNPIRTQAFVQPCIKAYGLKRVFQTLIDFLEKGTNYEKAGAVNALHWAGERKSNAESGRHNALSAEMLGMQDYKRILFLNTFISNTDLDVRRSTITYVDLDTLTATHAMKDLIEKVTKIARVHSDEYIKHRVEVQLGRTPSAYSLPARKRIDAPTEKKKGWWTQFWK